MSVLSSYCGLFFIFCLFVLCFVIYRVNILKISFKRKKFFIHQRQKQVSCMHACFVSCVLNLLQLLDLQGVGGNLPSVARMKGHCAVVSGFPLPVARGVEGPQNSV